MTKLKITVLKRTDPDAFLDEYPVKKLEWMVPCPVYGDGQEFILDKPSMPEGFCESAWRTIYASVDTLSNGGDYPYFEEKGVSITCCNDGLRPVVFKVERIEG
jgi:uncharacterized repeat protein (TIGR04076 family)